MKTLPLFFLFLLPVVSGHIQPPNLLENIAVNGDVPEAGYVELDGKSELTIAEALELAGYDLARLETSRQPYPVQISYEYIAERNPEIVLDLATQLQKSLQTSVTLGATIQVIDYELKLKHLEELEGQLDDNWEDEPDLAFQRLQEVVHLRRFLDEWQHPENKKKLSEYKSHYLSKLSFDSMDILKNIVLREIAEMAKEFEEENSPPRFVRVRINESLSWIDPENTEP